MKRLLAILVGLALATVLPGALAGSSSAAPERAAAAAPAPVTGRLIDYVDNIPAQNTRIELRSGPGGSLLGAGTTNSGGYFSVVRTGPLPTGGFYVRVVGNNWVQGGIVGGTPRWVQPSYSYGRRFYDGKDLGTVRANPSFVSGQLVDQNTLSPVAGATLRLRRAVDNVVVASATTTSTGRFRLYPIRGEDFNLQVIGSGVGYENGYRACDAQVVPTIGEACGSPLGFIGRVYLQP